ncbi:hypothetical protein CC78DRAFT_176879 [Lojkania enalia]|uniref:Uncharacterized protein n=1 Tax=Lojkania enalia TaxID=147567 RepID=A0A9P4KDR4_9PLEO|nr:hypothetical protein CC78DRAFT_176879 [Didymosphaeria enalia]
MAGRGRYSPSPSRSPSPGISPQSYDPFDPPLDPIEMATYGHLSTEKRDSLEYGRGSQQYEPVPDHSSGRDPRRSTTEGVSLYSMGSSLTHRKTMDADTQALIDRRAGGLAQWKVHWSTPAIIAALFVAGLIGALGHHFFYKHLDGRPAENQLKMIRYGTALAFFVKSTLVGTIILCYRQRIWHTFRKKAMTINAIDGLFAVTEDPSQFVNWEMIRNGKLATFMAACSWLIPIASVLSPASLTAEVRTTYNETQCPAVAALNFTHESLYNFRNESNYPGSSLVYYNTTDVRSKEEGWFDYYDQPSKNARRLTVTSAYLRKPAVFPNASVDSCGEAWNCTYSIGFQAPGYQCSEIANSSSPIPASEAIPFNLSILAPLGNYTYYSSVDLGDYVNPQVESNNGMPIQGPPYPETLGVFQAEPVLWIGYTINTTKPYEPSSPYRERWYNVHEPKIFKCILHHTNYIFEMKYNESVQSAQRTAREFLKPVVDTTVAPIGSPDFSDTSNLAASPGSNYVSPRADVEAYKLTAAYHAMGSLLRNFLRGSIEYTSFVVTKSDISETRLIQATSSYPLDNLMEEIQNLFEDMLITLLSEPHLIIADKQSVPCRKSRSVNVYVYYREGLWIGYAIVVAITTVFIGIGAYSIWQNGVASDTLFSRILVTTRNPTLDRLSVGACLGGDPFPKELRETKLRFGVLLEEDVKEGPLGRVEHCCFGAAGETKEIVKYGTYAGLKEWRTAEEDVTAEEKERLLAG